MKLEQLNYFLEAARHEHVGKAAKILAISPSAISHSIASLEEELGTPLFSRKGKNIFLTNHGKLLMNRAYELLNQVQSIRDELTADQVELQGHYRLAATHVLSTHFMAPAWVELQNKYTKATAELYSVRSAQVYHGVIQREFQLGLCFSPLPHPDLHMKSVYQGHMMIGLRRDHPIFSLPVRERVLALNHYTATLPKAFQGIDVCESHPMFKKFGIKPQIDMAYDHYEVAVEKVSGSLSWSLFPDLFFKWSAHHIRPLGHLQGWRAPYHISMIWSRHQYLPKALEKFIQGLGARFS